MIRYDQRGHGATQSATARWTVADLGSDVVGLLDAVGVKRASFCGISMGGLTGLWLGAHAGARLDRLVLANTAAKIGTADTWNARITAVRDNGMADLREAVFARWFTPAFRAAGSPLVDHLAGVFDRTDAAGYIASCEAIRDADLTPEPPRVTVPTLVIAGTHDASTPPAGGRAIADHVHGARFVELAAPHISNVECAADFNAALTAFLAA